MKTIKREYRPSAKKHEFMKQIIDIVHIHHVSQNIQICCKESMNLKLESGLSFRTIHDHLGLNTNWLIRNFR